MHALDIRWICLAVIVLCIEYAVALALGSTVGFNYNLPVRSYATIFGWYAAGGLAIGLLWQLFCLWREGEPRPSLHLPRRIPWAFAIGVMLVGLQSCVLQWTKIMMPLTVGFWADGTLASFDHAVFGQDPWRISHALFGALSPYIDKLYTTWGPLKFGMVLLLLWLPTSERKTHALMAYFLTYASGALGQYLGASAGPVFYDLMGLGDRFQDMPVAPWVAATRDYLWADYQRGAGLIGSGISAMPSMHVAMALWMTLTFRAYLPRLQVVAWAWFAAICVGSVHLGWHYASDGVIASGLAALAWKSARVMATSSARPAFQEATQ